MARIRIESQVRKIDPPVSGKGWVDMNGCCEPGGVHCATGLPVNGRLYFAQRFAIDWMRLDSSGRMVNGDAGDCIAMPTTAPTYWL
ncbi:MAG: hypothetical protein JO108_10000 [Acidobacteriaceae bacterium]|nr:hypothetical protein [Acidobacteriaceae bacterium]